MNREKEKHPVFNKSSRLALAAILGFTVSACTNYETRKPPSAATSTPEIVNQPKLQVVTKEVTGEKLSNVTLPTHIDVLISGENIPTNQGVWTFINEVDADGNIISPTTVLAYNGPSSLYNQVLIHGQAHSIEPIFKDNFPAIVIQSGHKYIISTYTAPDSTKLDKNERIVVGTNIANVEFTATK
jgi:hypothetical protein